eukprot:Sspe_Gene.5752::Locus_1910_Transcript_1_1_Confidence_1.000_Length_3194::g.5752::m.5752
MNVDTDVAEFHNNQTRATLFITELETKAAEAARKKVPAEMRSTVGSKVLKMCDIAGSVCKTRDELFNASAVASRRMSILQSGTAVTFQVNVDTSSGAASQPLEDFKSDISSSLQTDLTNIAGSAVTSAPSETTPPPTPAPTPGPTETPTPSPSPTPSQTPQPPTPPTQEGNVTVKLEMTYADFQRNREALRMAFRQAMNAELVEILKVEECTDDNSCVVKWGQQTRRVWHTLATFLRVTLFVRGTGDSQALVNECFGGSPPERCNQLRTTLDQSRAVDDDDGLDAGEIAGITIGVIVFVMLLLAFGYMCYRQKMKDRETAPYGEPHDAPAEPLPPSKDMDTV